jgi:hypothetical protein
MKLKELLHSNPELTEDKVLEKISERKDLLNFKTWSRNKYNSAKDILDEWDLIQIKKSNLTKSQREQLNIFVLACISEIFKDGRKLTSSD